MRRLEGKVAIITGAGSGIAYAATRIFAREGAKVIAAELDIDRGEASAMAAREAGGVATFVQVDVTNESSVMAMVNTAVVAYGRIDVLFNCAGGSVGEDRPVVDVDLKIWQHTMDLDLKGPFLCCRHTIPKMIAGQGGSIVNVASGAALRGSFPAHIYTAAKGGLLSFTRALAGSYSRNGIRANVICPGLVMSERIKARYGTDLRRPAESDQAVAVRSDAMSRYPFGKGEPEDIANIALFLASNESRMINGAVIPAEGGMHAY
jgi:NAD(P)-dependent dehydrogenase (short-subunit alcohol dehydrogenase family)